MKNQLGFIQIPILIGIVTSVIAMSLGIVIGLYKQGDASFATNVPETPTDSQEIEVVVDKNTEEIAKIKSEKAKLDTEIKKAKQESERVERELQKQLEEQRIANELKEQRERERLHQQEVELLQQEKTKKRLEQEEQNRVDQIYEQTDALLSEYYQKRNDIDAQILAINQKYYEDSDPATLRQGGISASGIQAQISELTREAIRKMELLQFEKESLRIEYLNKISALERSL